MEKKKLIRKKDFATIILRLGNGETPDVIAKDFPQYAQEQIFVAARTAGFNYIKRGGVWYESR